MIVKKLVQIALTADGETLYALDNDGKLWACNTKSTGGGALPVPKPNWIKIETPEE